MTVNVNSEWVNIANGEKHTVTAVISQAGIFGKVFTTVHTVTNTGVEYTHTVESLNKYYNEVTNAV